MSGATGGRERPADGPGRGLLAGVRGQSEVLGFALVIGIVIGGSVLVLTLGGASLTDAQEQVQSQRAEKTMTELDSRAALVALGQSESQTIDLVGSTDGDFDFDDDEGHMIVAVTNTTTGDSERILNATLGTVEYENGGTTVAYQGGGVWRANRRNGSKMISPPEFHYRNRTLTLPIVTINTEPTSGSRLTVERASDPIQAWPNTSKNRPNPLENGRTVVSVQSEYYQAWGQFFEERTDGNPRYDHANNTVNATLVVPSNRPPVRGGLVSSATTLTVEENAFVDGYNSSIGEYSISQTDNGQIRASQDVDIDNNGVVRGDIETDGDITSENNADVFGNISYGGSASGFDGNHNGQWFANNGSVASPDSVTSTIRTKVRTLESSNDNADSGVDIDESTDTLENCASTCTLTAGQYYLDGVDLSSGTIEVDTSSGPVDIAVDGDFTLRDNNALNLQVTGPNRANLYINGSVTIRNGARVETTTPHVHNSTQVWFYTDPTETGLIKNQAEVTGVLYGPGTAGGGTEYELKQNAQVFGAVVGDIDSASQNYEIHYDEELQDTSSLIGPNNVPAVTYLHISENPVNVTAG